MVELNSFPPARKTGPLMIGLLVCLALRPASPLVTEGAGGGRGGKNVNTAIRGMLPIHT